MAWRLGVGNLISRAPASGVASGSSEDPLYPLVRIGDGFPDDPARWLWESDGAYAATFDLNLLAITSPRSDAPTGWADLANKLASTPGLGANPPVWGTFATRHALKAFAPVFQDIEVMPGEDLRIQGGVRFLGSGSCTAVRVVVIDLDSGEQWDGVLDAWNDNADPVAAQAVADTWLDYDETLVHQSQTRRVYRVILWPVAPAYDATSEAYFSDPILTASQDFVAVIGHNVPVGATFTWSDGTNTRTITGQRPSDFKAGTASNAQNWTLTVTMPTNTSPIQNAPFIGELWVGKLLDMEDCPIYPFDILEKDDSQQRLEGGLGRLYVRSEVERAPRLFTMKFKSTEGGFEDSRDALLRATRFGHDPLVLVPVDGIDTDVIWHGRVGQEVTFSQVSRTRRTYEIKLNESPFPRFTR